MIPSPDHTGTPIGRETERGGQVPFDDSPVKIVECRRHRRFRLEVVLGVAMTDVSPLLKRGVGLDTGHDIAKSVSIGSRVVGIVSDDPVEAGPPTNLTTTPSHSPNSRVEVGWDEAG
jgi:hypothetical protein